jgi:hypothetical protein
VSATCDTTHDDAFVIIRGLWFNMVSQRSWSEYDTWNDAIAQVIFPSLLRPNPVYIDLEDDQLAAIGSLLDISPADADASRP